MEITNTTEEKSTYIGQCKWFNDKCGYGFISYSTEGNLKEPNKDVFVHYTNIKPKEDSEYKILQSGEYVQFEIKAISDESNEHKEQAVNITGINGGHLFNEYRNSLRRSGSGFDSTKDKFGGFNKPSYNTQYRGRNPNGRGRMNFSKDNKPGEGYGHSKQEWTPK
tara:strand:- start:378 stop:872 length:495 start_codon:yes stop_codon:yes gene_type:complete